MHIPDAAVGSIIAAIIAGLVVFISTVLSKEQKTSEFRQVWIDQLRDDIAKYISGTTEISTLYQLKGENDGALKLLEDNVKLISETEALAHKIILRLNPSEHGGLIQKIKDFRKQLLAISPTAQGAEERLAEAIINDSKDILKKEWERVKRGETLFRSVKWIALAVVVALIFLSIFLFSSNKTEDKRNVDSSATQRQLGSEGEKSITQSIQLTIGDSQLRPPSSGSAIKRNASPSATSESPSRSNRSVTGCGTTPTEGTKE